MKAKAFRIGNNFNSYTLYEVGDAFKHWYLYSDLEKKRIPNTVNLVHKLQNLYFALTGKELDIKNG